MHGVCPRAEGKDPPLDEARQHAGYAAFQASLAWVIQEADLEVLAPRLAEAFYLAGHLIGRAGHDVEVLSALGTRRVVLDTKPDHLRVDDLGRIASDGRTVLLQHPRLVQEDLGGRHGRRVRFSPPPPIIRGMGPSGRGDE